MSELPEQTNACLVVFDPNLCFDSAIGFSSATGCDFDVVCFYGSPAGIPNSAPCVLNDSDSTRCNGVTGGPAHVVSNQPGFCVNLTNGNTFADLSDGGWVATRGDVQWFLRDRSMTFQIEPCTPRNYCTSGNFWLKWLTRIFIRDTSGWRMQCNEIERCTDRPCNQLVRKDIDVTLIGPIGITHLGFAMLSTPLCWFQADMYCFVRSCPETEVDCEGTGRPGFVDAVNEPLFSSSARLSTRNADGQEYPYSSRQAFRTQLVNAAWDEMDDFSDRLDMPGHGASNRYDSASLGNWAHSEDLVGTIVQGNPTHYAAYDGVDIPLKAIDTVSRLEIDAVLTLTQLTVELYMNADIQGDGHRLTASCLMKLGVRVKLTGSVPAGLTLLNAGDPFDLRLQADGSPGVEHATRKLTVIGPNKERVPHQSLATPATPHDLRWEGLRSSQWISNGPYTFIENTCGDDCCGVAKNIADSPISGRTNDNTQFDGETFTPKEQRFDGFIAVTPRDMSTYCPACA